MLLDPPSPSVIVIGGPNGAGKTTISRPIIGESFGVPTFVNADIIAQGLSGFNPEALAFQAGRIMLNRLRELAAERAIFAFESTLASRTFEPWIRKLIATGYDFHLLYVWLDSAELAQRRVRLRVKRGGHHIPDEIVERRYFRSITNFYHLYRPLARTWRFYDNSSDPLRIIAAGGLDQPDRILDPTKWCIIQELADEANEDK